VTLESISVRSERTTVVSAEAFRNFPDESDNASPKLTTALNPRRNIGAHGEADNKTAVPTTVHAPHFRRKEPDDLSQLPNCTRF